MAKKRERVEGVALNVRDTPDRYADGVPVSAPKTTAPKKAATEKAGQQANTTKEKD